MKRLKHRVHPGDTQDQAVGGRHRPPGKRRAGPARHHRHALFGCDPQDGADFLGRARQDCCQRRTAVGCQRVTFIDAQFTRIVDHRISRQHRPQSGNDPALAGDDGGIGLWHLHGGLRRIGKEI
jgi:hypothetical protein